MKRTDTKHIRAGKEKILEASKLTNGQARCLVANYYMAQDLRKRGDMQLRHLGDKDDPVSMLNYYAESQAAIESDLQKALEVFARASPVGRWMLRLHGVGPVIAAGMLAHIDITRAPTAGHIWRFADLDPSSKWVSRVDAEKMVAAVLRQQKIKKPNDMTIQMICAQINRKTGTVRGFATTDHAGALVPLSYGSLVAAVSRRPYNPDLKQICFHAGECFKRISNDPNASLYSRFYRDRKAHIVARNERGEYAERAKTYTTRSADVRKLLDVGKLPAGNLDKQACDQAVKIFLSHLHAVLHWDYYGAPPPKPFVLATVGPTGRPLPSPLGHAHEVRIPNLDMFPGLEDAYYGRAGLSDAAE